MRLMVITCATIAGIAVANACNASEHINGDSKGQSDFGQWATEAHIHSLGKETGGGGGGEDNYAAVNI